MADIFEKQDAFLAAMQRILQRAKDNGGSISTAEIEAALEGQNLSDAQMEQVRAYLTANKIGIDKPVPLDELLTPEEKKALLDYEEQMHAIEPPTPSVLEAMEINAMAGDAQAQNDLVTAMLPNVPEIAKLYAGQGVYIDDLIGVGNVTLVRAVKLLEPLEGPGEVGAFLTKQIMDAMEDAVSADLDEAGAMADVAAHVNKVSDAAHALSEDLGGRKVTVAELAAEGALSEEDIREAIRLSGGKIPDIAEADQK